MPASSTTTVVPAGSWNSGRGGRSGRCHSWSSLATVSGRIAGLALEHASRFRRRRHPEHGPTVGVEVGDGGGEHAGLAGAGRADDEDEAVVSRRRRLPPPPASRRARRRSTVVDGAGGSVWASIAQVMMCSSSASTASEVKRGAVGSIHSERPSDARRAGRVGRVEIDTVLEYPVGGRSMVSSQRRPDICDTGRCTSQIACTTSGRPHDECCADTAATTSPTVNGTAGSAGGLRLDLGDELFDGPAGVGGFGRHRVTRSAAP